MCTIVHIMPSAVLEWSADKAAVNLRKHGVDFADAALVFTDDLALTMQNPHSVDEWRYLTMGNDAGGRLLVVAFTWRGDRIRLISARTATRQERRRYERLP